MANEPTNAIAQAVADATRGAIQALAAARAERTQNAGPRLDGPMMKQPNFNWKAGDKYNEFKNFRLEVNNNFKSYNTPQTEQLAIIKNWLSRNGLQLLES